jgi:hypothetical protein
MYSSSGPSPEEHDCEKGHEFGEDACMCMGLDENWGECTRCGEQQLVTRGTDHTTATCRKCGRGVALFGHGCGDDCPDYFKKAGL